MRKPVWSAHLIDTRFSCSGHSRTFPAGSSPLLILGICFSSLRIIFESVCNVKVLIGWRGGRENWNWSSQNMDPCSCNAPPPPPAIHPFPSSFSLTLHSFPDLNKSRFLNLMMVHSMGETLHLERKNLKDGSCEFQEVLFNGIYWNLSSDLLPLNQWFSFPLPPVFFLRGGS